MEFRRVLFRSEAAPIAALSLLSQVLRCGRSHMPRSTRKQSSRFPSQSDCQWDGPLLLRPGTVSRMGCCPVSRVVGISRFMKCLLHESDEAWRCRPGIGPFGRSEEHTSELQSLLRFSYDVFC